VPRRGFEAYSFAMMNMRDFQPIVVGGLLVSAFRDALLTERYVAWLNDPEVVRFSEQRHHTHTLDSCGRYLAGMRLSDGLFLSIEVLEGGLWHVGNISVAVDRPNSSADLSIMLGESKAWGRGYASVAWNAVIGYLLGKAGLRRVTAGTMEVNDPMIRLMRRSGMQVDGVRPRHFLWEGREVGLVTASRFRDPEADRIHTVDGSTLTEEVAQKACF
jgi:ribosomal-protein-alanine N-acetyltransferase